MRFDFNYKRLADKSIVAGWEDRFICPGRISTG
jgi:hypothetical protein